MGFWKTDKGIIIGDEYADILEKMVDRGWKKIKKTYPKINQEQYAETIRFILNRFGPYKEGQIND